MSIISVKNLCKNFKILNRHEGLKGAIRDLFSRDYKTIEAVKEIDFSIESGEIVGFVGPNGAGKSTTIKMLTGVLKPDSGSILVNGMEPFGNRRVNAKNIAVVFGQRTQLWWDLPVIESFRLLKEIYKISQEKFHAVLDSFNRLVALEELYAKPVRSLSLGQRMLCDIAASFLHNPKIIFLDEPTIGLDISVKSKIRILIQELNREHNTTVILTTHDISDIEALCKRIIIIDKGSLVYDGPIQKVRSLIKSYRALKITLGQTAIPEDYKQIDEFCQANFIKEKVTTEIQDDGWFKISFSEEDYQLMEILNSLTGRFPVKDIKVEEISTESVIRKIYEGALA